MSYYVIKSGDEYLSKFLSYNDSYPFKTYEDTFTQFDFQRTFIYDTEGKAIKKLKTTKAKNTKHEHYESIQEKLNKAAVIEVEFTITEKGFSERAK